MAQGKRQTANGTQINVVNTIKTEYSFGAEDKTVFFSFFLSFFPNAKLPLLSWVMGKWGTSVEENERKKKKTKK